MLIGTVPSELMESRPAVKTSVSSNRISNYSLCSSFEYSSFPRQRGNRLVMSIHRMKHWKLMVEDEPK
ncbi:hypothetical protein LINPERHAP2_LOCUS40106 [Linum perenne]